MIVVGKLLGAVFGVITGGIFGALIGAVVGHFFIDKRLQDMGFAANTARVGGTSAEQTQQTFFESCFLVMGHIAKADGQVTQSEISAAEQTMGRMRLTEAQRKQAIGLFQQGKQPEFNLDQTMSQLRKHCGRAPNLLRFFLEIQIQVAMADGEIDSSEQAILLKIGRYLGLPSADLRRLADFLRAGQRFGGGQQTPEQQKNHLQAAYDVIGVQANSTDAEVKKAYRKLMSQHHPDKLAAKGLPPEMLRVAEEKAQQITAAYDTIKDARGGIK